MVRVLADSRIDSVVPTVKATDQIVAVDVPVGHQSPAVQAATIEDRDLVLAFTTLVTHDY